MTLKTLSLALAFAALPVAIPTIAAAAPINAPVPTENYVTIGSLDWAWAAPCAAFGNDSCGVVDMTYQSTQGWRIASVSEVAAYILPDITGFIANFGPSDGFKCAAAWFSVNHLHCDYVNGVEGAIYNGAFPNQGYFDSFAVRGMAAVPVPAAGLMLASVLGGVALMRRRRRG